MSIARKMIIMKVLSFCSAIGGIGVCVLRRTSDIGVYTRLGIFGSFLLDLSFLSLVIYCLLERQEKGKIVSTTVKGCTGFLCLVVLCQFGVVVGYNIFSREVSLFIEGFTDVIVLVLGFGLVLVNSLVMSGEED